MTVTFKTLIFSLVGSMVLFMQTAFAQSYVFDNQRTKINFKISMLGSIERQGTFSRFSGGVNYISKNINTSKLHLKVATKSLNIDLPKGLEKLASGDLFQTHKYPYMVFDSKTLAMKKYSKKAVKGKITGTLSFMGKKHLETFHVRFREIKNTQGNVVKILFHGSATINRGRYGIKLPALARVGNHIPIKISGVLLPK